jgi:pimeloyl-ACP methyl ester carboxylesterase
MAIVTTSDGTAIFVKDRGSGQPIVFHHGWPLRAGGRASDFRNPQRIQTSARGIAAENTSVRRQK